MEFKANARTIGGFILAIIAALFIFVLWITRASEGRNFSSFDIMFDGSISGLVKGSGVLFNGIRVGSVANLSLNPTDPKQVIARVTVDPTTPIRTDTKVSLEYSGLTGSAQISMRGGASSAAIIPSEKGRVPVLFAETSAVQDLMQAVRQITGRADAIVERLDRLVLDNQVTVTESMKDVKKFTGVLADNSDAIAAFLKESSEAAKKVSSLTAKLDTVLAVIEPDKIKSTLNNVDTFTTAIAAQTPNMTAFFVDAKSAAGNLDRNLTELNRVLKALDEVKLANTVNNIEAFTGSLAKNTGRVDQFLADTAGAARNIKELVLSLDRRTNEMSSGILAFTNKSAREVESLASDGRRAIGQIDRSLRSLESNPSRVIFGGSNVPEHNRR